MPGGREKVQWSAAPLSDQGSGSKWSSAREREERERTRRQAQEQARRERVARESGEPIPPTGSGLTESERITIRKYQFPTSEERPSRQVTPPQPPETTGSTSTSETGSVGTRWRDSAPPPTGGGPELPNLPGDDGGNRRGGGNGGRAIWFGLTLFAAVAVLLFLPFGPFGGDNERRTPTPSATLPSILSTAPADGQPDGTGIEPTPRPGDGQPIVCIDAGHGGWDTGWVRSEEADPPYGPPITTEADMNLGMAWMLKSALEAEGIYVVMTRLGGTAVNMFDEDIDGNGETRTSNDNPRYGQRDEFQARINICNEAGADILISLHLNGVEDRDARGYEVIYTAEREFGEQNAELATVIYRQLDAAMRGTEMESLGRDANPDTDIQTEDGEFGSGDHYVMTGPALNSPDFQTVPSAMPGVIVEAAFLSNDADAVWIAQPANQQIVVDAYVRGILDYFAMHPA
jgi:N-acetylmuramoyl-L-alanine amidase